MPPRMTLTTVIVGPLRQASNDAASSGSSSVDFEKGKSAVLLADVKELAVVLPKLIAATEAGELDGHINAVSKAKQPVVMKR